MALAKFTLQFMLWATYLQKQLGLLIGPIKFIYHNQILQLFVDLNLECNFYSILSKLTYNNVN